jgi:two-component system sensor histidine kinase QseC
VSEPASLRRRLLFLLLGAILLLWIAIAAVSFYAARHETDELMDAQLAQSTQVIMALAQADMGQVATEVEEFKHRYEQKLSFQIFDPAGRLLLRTANAPPGKMSDAEDGFSNTVVEGVVWRVFSRWESGRRFLVQVGQSEEIRDELAEHIMLTLLAPVLFAFPVVALVIWVSVGRGLIPLQRAAREVQARDPGNLTPLDAEGAPAEIRPLLGALNALFRRLGEAFELERRFTADAAHELRTPLAALRTQAQVALRAADDAGRRRALEQVIAGVDRATQLVEQLLTLARVDPETSRAGGAPVNLDSMASEVLAELAPAALGRGTELRLEEPRGEPRTRGDRAMLGVLLRNLADNAIRYTPAGGAVRVATGADQGHAWLEVEDNGPGIPEHEREKVFERFYRMLGTGTSGSGLGLSIVRRIAELHGANLALADGAGGRGLRVRVTFPVPAGEAAAAHPARGLFSGPSDS